MQANKTTAFFMEHREKGVPASQVPPDVVQPLVDKVISAPEEQLLHSVEVHQHPFKEPPHCFASFVCELCGEMTIEAYGRILGEKKVCIPCRDAAVTKA